MRKFRVLAAATAAALAVGLGACHKEAGNASPYGTPEATVKAYVTAMKQGDFEAALDCYADSALSTAGVGVAGLTREEVRNLFLKSLANSQEPYVKSEPAKLQVKMMTAEVTYELGGAKHTHTLVNQNGEWKIATDLATK